MLKRSLFLFLAFMPIPAFAQSTVVTSMPRPAQDTAISQGPPPGSAAYIPSPDLPYGPPTTPVEVYTRPERQFAFTLESQLLFPEFVQHLQAPITVPGFYNDIAQLPGADMGLAGAVAFSVRTRALGGEIGVTYRYMAAEGTDQLSNFDPTGDVPWRSRLDMHLLDLDYFSREYNLPKIGLLRWDAGARLTSIYYDTEASGPIFDRRVINYFFGAGPHAGLNLSHALGGSGLSVIGRVDGGAMIGGIHQQFADTVFDSNGNTIGFGYSSQRGTQGVPMLVAELGIGTAAGGFTRGQWQVGYHFEQLWNVGNVGSSSADLLSQGLYARWVFRY